MGLGFDKTKTLVKEFIMMDLGRISKLSKAQTRSISPENVYGEKGKGAMALPDGTLQADVARIGQNAYGEKRGFAKELGLGWKVRPSISLPAKSTTTIMDVDGPGVIRHMWFTFNAAHYRDIIIRIYWDNETEPSVEAPLGDFFCCGFRTPAKIMALPVNVNPTGGMNSFFPMPFRKHARIVLENRFVIDVPGFFYTINYELTEIADDEAYFHAQFHRSSPVPAMKNHIILDGIKGRGHYVGCYLAWKQSRTGWWGEGEFKAWLDGDGEFPSVCGTGTEDYFGGAWGFGETFSAPFMGYPYTSFPLETKRVPTAGSKHGLYRFHIMDPIRFEHDLTVAIQPLGWKNRFSFVHLQDDIASVGYWYQSEPHQAFSELPDPVTVDDVDLYA